MRGGLGNQMFQYAYALALRERYPGAEIWMDTREYVRYKRRAFALDSFRLAADTAPFSEGKLRYDLPIKLYHVYQRLYRELHGKAPYGLNEGQCRRGLILTGTGCPLPTVPLPDEAFLYGYFQNADVLLPIRDTLKAAFSLPEERLQPLEESLSYVRRDSAAVSIRLGGDIVKSGWQLCSREYYRDALQALREKTPIDNLFVFSYMPDKVSEEKWFDDLGLEIHYTNGLSPVEQMELLSRCRHFVISNSTFAWWGAFLGAGDSEGWIAAPRLWQGNLPTSETKLMLPNMLLL